MKKSTLTVAIPAFNEQVNISALLYSLIEQKNKINNLKEIVVYSDASTDNTHQIVREISKKHTVVKLKAGKQRKGKYARMSDIFKDCTSDVLVILDADIKLVGTDFLDKLTEIFKKDYKATMIAAHQVLIRPKTIIGKILHTQFVMWDFIRWSVPEYDNANNFYGSATAFRGDFARTLSIPTNLSDPHLYIYLMADRHKGFRYARNAEILQQPISTWKDFNKFLHRTLGKKDPELEKLMDVNTETVHLIPWKYKLKGLYKAFLWQPIYIFPALLVTLYMKLQPQKVDDTPIWNIVTSTKKPIQYAEK